MLVGGVPYRTIWLADDGWSVHVIDQRRLPHEFTTLRLTTVEEAAHAIRDMVVRGAPLIGAAAAYGLCLALRRDPSDAGLAFASTLLRETRPTAVNLAGALERVTREVAGLSPADRADAAYACAHAICDEDVATNRSIGEHGLVLLKKMWEERASTEPLNVLTHCNAGWLATVDGGTALAPIYAAHEAGLAVHVWVDETRPRNQGAGLTAWELRQHGVPHTLIVDNAGGHLMREGLVDGCITGSDRTTAAGDVCNKIGTYLKALAARDNDLPFFVALPGSTIDWSIDAGSSIPIELRSPDEVSDVVGRAADGTLVSVKIAEADTPIANYAFDVTPSKLVTALITERGVCAASKQALSDLFPEHQSSPARGRREG